MIRDILVPLSHTPGDAHALSVASELSTQYRAHLAVVEPLELPLPPVDVPAGLLLDPLYDELRQRSAQTIARVRERLDAEGTTAEVRLGEALLLPTGRMLALQARYADLVVAAAPDAGSADAGEVSARLAALLFESGRPLLTVPAMSKPMLPLGHAVVAWQPTREASRALHDALPLLQLAGSVDVVSVDPAVGERAHGEDPGTDIAAHLARHGLRVNVIALPARDEPVATALLRHAWESGAHLLVAGGYGHSRLREWLIGGTTRDLLHGAQLPVLFAH